MPPRPFLARATCERGPRARLTRRAHGCARVRLRRRGHVRLVEKAMPMNSGRVAVARLPPPLLLPLLLGVARGVRPPRRWRGVARRSRACSRWLRATRGCWARWARAASGPKTKHARARRGRRRQVGARPGYHGLAVEVRRHGGVDSEADCGGRWQRGGDGGDAAPHRAHAPAALGGARRGAACGGGARAAAAAAAHAPPSAAAKSVRGAVAGRADQHGEGGGAPAARGTHRACCPRASAVRGNCAATFVPCRLPRPSYVGPRCWAHSQVWVQARPRPRTRGAPSQAPSRKPRSSGAAPRALKAPAPRAAAEAEPPSHHPLALRPSGVPAHGRACRSRLIAGRARHGGAAGPAARSRVSGARGAAGRGGQWVQAAVGAAARVVEAARPPPYPPPTHTHAPPRAQARVGREAALARPRRGRAAVGAGRVREAACGRLALASRSAPPRCVALARASPPAPPRACPRCGGAAGSRAARGGARRAGRAALAANYYARHRAAAGRRGVTQHAQARR